MASTTTPTETTWSPRLWGALFVLCGALFLDGLDVSMVGVALPSIGTDLHMSTTALQWVVSGYVLGYGGLLLLGGRAADLLGRRRMFLIAVAAFAAASLLGGLVHDGTLLVATRFIKGIAAAFTAPAGLSIITTTFAEGPARNRALSIYTIFGASGFFTTADGLTIPGFSAINGDSTHNKFAEPGTGGESAGYKVAERRSTDSDAPITIFGSFVGSCVGSTCTITAVPEPASLSLLGAGLFAFGVAWRRKRRSANLAAA